MRVKGYPVPSRELSVDACGAAAGRRRLRIEYGAARPLLQTLRLAEAKGEARTEGPRGRTGSGYLAELRGNAEPLEDYKGL